MNASLNKFPGDSGDFNIRLKTHMNKEPSSTYRKSSKSFPQTPGSSQVLDDHLRQISGTVKIIRNYEDDN